jgi:hypothetical protein
MGTFLICSKKGRASFELTRFMSLEKLRRVPFC